MATNTHVSGIRVTDENSNKWDFPLMPTDRGGVGLVIEPRPWEPGDPLRRWRIPLHPFIGGLNVDRLNGNPTTYATGTVDATYPNLLLFSPHVYSLTMANGDTPVKDIDFDNLKFFIGGRYAYYLDPTTNALTEDKDFGASKSAVDAAVFNNELIVAMGESEKIWKRSIGVNTSGTADAAVTTTNTTLADTRLALTVNAYIGATVTCNAKTMVVTSNTATTFTGASWSGGGNPGNGNAWSVAGTWTQASDATYAIALGVVGSYLWRAHDTNQVDNCSTTPLTLANWLPADPNEYTVGDSTYAVNRILDYGGIAWVFKGDGVYAPDPQSRFKNQAPQLARTPHADNGKGAFVAQGSLWAPSSSGLFQIRTGRSRKRGPELTFRPNYRFWVRGGVEYGDYIYLLVTDESATGSTFICKMTPDSGGITGRDYIYQEWARLDGTSKGYFIGITTAGTNPELVAGYGATGVRYIKLGRGGGRDVDDPNYHFDTFLSLETGEMMPGSDLSELSTLVGVDILCDFSRTNDTLTLSYRWDPKRGTESYTNLLDEAESGSGTAAITGTNGWDRVSRYAAANNTGRFLGVQFDANAALGGSASASVTTTDTSLTDTRLTLTTNSLIGATITCNSKTMTITSNTATALTGTAWSGGSNPGNSQAWSLDIGGAGVIRPAIREAWAYGYSHQTHTDVISLGIWAIDGAEVNGRFTGISRDECVRKWRDWQNRGVELLLEMEGYERGRNTRVLVKKVEVLNALATPGKHPGTTALGDQVKVQLVRIDRQGTYAE